MNYLEMEQKQIKTIQEGFISKLKNSDGWDNHLYTRIHSDHFASALIELNKQVDQNKKFTPKFKNIFRSFELCPFEDLKVVIVGQDPYPQEDVADGVSFSCSNTNKEQPSLRYIFDELQNQYPNASRDCDLSRWSKQGVLMLNTALTCEINNIGSHVLLWKDFMTDVFINTLNKHHNDLQFVFLGKKSEVFGKYIDDRHTKHFVIHPAAAAYRGGKWNCDNLFKKINENLKQKNKKEIQW